MATPSCALKISTELSPTLLKCNWIMVLMELMWLEMESTLLATRLNYAVHLVRMDFVAIMTNVSLHMEFWSFDRQLDIHVTRQNCARPIIWVVFVHMVPGTDIWIVYCWNCCHIFFPIIMSTNCLEWKSTQKEPVETLYEISPIWHLHRVVAQLFGMNVDLSLKCWMNFYQLFVLFIISLASSFLPYTCLL